MDQYGHTWSKAVGPLINLRPLRSHMAAQLAEWDPWGEDRVQDVETDSFFGVEYLGSRII